MEQYQAGVGTATILAEHGGTQTALLRMVKRHGVPTQPGGRRHRQFTDEQVAEMARLWHEEGLSQSRIAARFDTAQVVVSRVLMQAGITPSPRHPRPRGAAHASWRGGVTKAGDYLQEKVAPDDPMFVMANRMGYVLQHRLVMARALGRPLTPHETVHHRNAPTTDNRLQNLQLRQGQHGKGVVARCGDCGSHNITMEAL